VQRLNDTDIFLKPDGAGSRICRLTQDGILEGARVSLSPDSDMSLSAGGWIAAVTGKGRRLWAAQIDAALKVTSVSSRLLPDGVRATSTATVGQRLFVGGTMNRGTWLGMGDFREPAPGLQALALPTGMEVRGKPIDDLLVYGSRLLAIDNMVLPKWILVYDMNRGERPALVHHGMLPHHHTYEHIHHGAVGGGWLAILSSSVGRAGSFRHLAIYDAGSFREFAVLSFETDRARAFSVEAVGTVAESGSRRWSESLSAQDALPSGFYPVQVVCVESRFYILSAGGEVVSLPLGRLGPERVAALDGLDDWFCREPVDALTKSKPTRLVAVPARGRVVVMNPEGQTAVLGMERRE